MSTPAVLFIFFRRQGVALKVFERIAAAKPAKLYLACDGPRVQRPDEAEAVFALRELILSRIDWPCEVFTNFSDTNVGCAIRISSAVTWLFEHESEGIILEEDCMPDPSFFDFSRVMLERYRDDARVMHIAGYNCFDPKKTYSDGDYFYTRSPLIWGWAGWRRAWQHYDLKMSTYPVYRQSNVFKFYKHQPAFKLIGALNEYLMNRVYQENNGVKPRTFAYPWAYAVAIQNGLCINPRVNLITNLGVGSDATHQRLAIGEDVNRPTAALTSYNAPSVMLPNADAERYMYQKHHEYSVSGLFKKVITKFWLKLKAA